MKFGYVRVSTKEQSEQRQIDNLENYGIDRWFIEHASGKNLRRIEFQKMLEIIREGDVIYVDEFSRIARNTKDLYNVIENLQNKGIFIVSHKEKLDLQTPQGKLMFGLIASIAEFEREAMLERQREGIRIAKEAGKYSKSRKIVIKNKEDEELFEALYNAYKNREITKKMFADKLGISVTTLNKVIRKQLGLSEEEWKFKEEMRQFKVKEWKAEIQEAKRQREISKAEIKRYKLIIMDLESKLDKYSNQFKVAKKALILKEEGFNLEYILETTGYSITEAAVQFSKLEDKIKETEKELKEAKEKLENFITNL